MPLIQSPPVEWPALQRQTVRQSYTLRAGLTEGDYGTLTLTVREDPLWDAAHGGRWGRDAGAAKWADPVREGWPVVAEVTGTWDDAADEPTATFEIDVPAGAGEKRYAVDVVAESDTVGRVELFPVTWLTVWATNRPPAPPPG